MIKKIFWRFIVPFTIGFLGITLFLYCVSVNTPLDFSEIDTYDFLIYGYFAKWGDSLLIVATAIFAFAAFWTVSDTRYFRYIDDKTKILDELGKWVSQTLRSLIIPARYTKNPELVIANIKESRNELLIAIASSISVFAKIKAFIKANERVTSNRVVLLNALSDVTTNLQDYIAYLTNLNFETFSQAQFDRLGEKAQLTTDTLRKLIELAAKID